jgi:hypothetical protein
VIPKPTYSPKTLGPIRGAPRNLAPRRVTSTGKNDRRLLFVRDDLATFCSCFSSVRT